MSKVKILTFKEVPPGTVFVTGFAGFGMVGYLTVDYLINKLRPERVGFVITKYLPDTVSYSPSYGIETPFELYLYENRVLFLHNRWLPHPLERSYFARAIAKWLKKVKVKYALLVGGLDKSFQKDPSSKMMWVKTSHYSGELPEEQSLPEGLHIVGPLALLLAMMEVEGIPALTILPFCESARQDPRAAAVAVDYISRRLGINVDTKELIERANLIERELEKLQRLMEARTSHKESHYM